MKKFILSITLVAIAATFTLAQTQTKSTPAPTKTKTEAKQPPATQTKAPVSTAPEITFDKLEYDYGDIQHNQEAVCVFTFKNTGREPLILTNVSASCGCTVPEWPREPILPNKTGTIKVKYDSKNLGNFVKQITVYSNATLPSVVLTIKGKVVDKNGKTQ